MDFYSFTYSFERRWAFAASIEPQSHVIRWNCPECRRAATYPAGAFDVTVEGGKSYPDLLGCGAYPLLIVSERVISVLKQNGVHCFQEFPVRVAKVEDGRARLEDAPNYYRLEITGECMIDFAASGITVQGICGRCGELTRTPAVTPRFELINGSWDGSDLFRDQRYFPRRLFTTQRIVDLVKEHGLTNWEFEPMGS